MSLDDQEVESIRSLDNKLAEAENLIRIRVLKGVLVPSKDYETMMTEMQTELDEKPILYKLFGRWAEWSTEGRAFVALTALAIFLTVVAPPALHLAGKWVFYWLPPGGGQ